MAECQEAITFYADAANKAKKFTFAAYKRPGVVKVLNELFHYKCAYCESYYAHIEPVDVEHYRPKGGVVVDGKLRTPGYYWLAAEWTNLLPSCIDCNRVRTHEVPGSTAPKKSGKGNSFPLVDEAGRAKQPGEEGHEEPLLLNPCLDEPAEHLEFTDEGVVRPAVGVSGEESPKGRTSISVYGLQRMGLVRRRRAYVKFILATIERVKIAQERLSQSPSDAERQSILDALARDMLELKAYRDRDREYAGMARQVIDTAMETLSE